MPTGRPDRGMRLPRLKSEVLALVSDQQIVELAHYIAHVR